MTPSAILESALYVTDLVAAETFYADIIGLPLISKAEGRHVFFRCGDGVLLLFNAEATRQPSKPMLSCRCRRMELPVKGTYVSRQVLQKSRTGRRVLKPRASPSKRTSNGPPVGAQSIFATRPATPSNLPNHAFGELHERPIGQEDRRRQPQ